ncbi:MAG: EVE domain-containing protein [Phycisphaerae bacterium]
MNRWLIKSDPETYSAKDLEREGRTFWDGVANPLALKHLGSMAAGDEVLVYHTGDERAIVATAKIASKPIADPKDKSGKISLVDVQFTGWLAKPVTLDQIKADAAMANWELVKISRLSVMPVPKGIWDKIQKLAAS